MQHFTRYLRLAGCLGLLWLLGTPARAQYNSPNYNDGVINNGDYGTHADGQNQQTTNNGATTWYMTYDATYLYIGTTGINGGDAAFTYLDVNPTVPVNGGGVGDGNLSGIGYDNHNFNPLPFRADYAIYTNRGFQQLLKSSGGGSWTSVGTGPGTVDAYIVDGLRELRIPWSKLGGMPASYNWFGYASYQNNGSTFLFGSVPTGNPNPTGLNVGSSTTLEAPFYYTVSVVANGATATKPFSRISYTFPGTSSIGSFGAFSVYDLTLNAPGRTLSRGCGGGNWNIGGTLTVGGGELYFGSTGSGACSGYGTTNVGNVNVVGGLLDLDYTNNPLVASGNVTVNGGTLRLSNTSGGDLRLAGNLTLTGGTFTPRTRALLATGTTQTLTGSAATPLALDYLFIQQASSGSTVTLGSSASVSTQLGFGTGRLLTGSNVLSLGTTGVLSSETSSSNLEGFVSAIRTVGGGGSGTVNFGNLGLTLTPTGSSAVLGATTVTRSRAVGVLRDKNNNQSINRNYRVEPTNSAGPFEATLVYSYFDSELSSVPEANLELFSSTNVPTYPTSGTGSYLELGFTSRDAGANTLTRTALTNFGEGSGIVFTLGDQAAPLPVTLVRFEGRRIGAAVQLTWATGLELDNAGFGIERRTGEGAWQALAFVPGTGSSHGSSYEYADAQAPAGLLYYRLRQLDFNGRATYSPVVTVAASGAEAVLHLSPVPTPAGQPTLAVDLSALPAAERTLTIYDLQGRLLVHTTAPATAATADLPVAALAAGTYVVRVQGGAATYHSRFVKL